MEVENMAKQVKSKITAKDTEIAVISQPLQSP
jgi:hypothetical protein